MLWKVCFDLKTTYHSNFLFPPVYEDRQPRHHKCDFVELR